MADLKPHFPASDDALRMQHDGVGDVAGADVVARAAHIAATVRERGFAVVRELLAPDEVGASCVVRMS